MDIRHPLAQRTGVLHLSTQERFEPAIETLRRTDYDPAAGMPFLRDAFDDHSTHVLARIGGELVGAMRLTQPPGVLRSWLRPPDQLPMIQGPQVIEFTRGVVAHPWRGLGIYQLFMCAGVLRACETAGIGIATVEVSLHVRGFLGGLGFRECGPAMSYYHAPGCSTLAQGLQVDLAVARPLAAQHLHGLKQRLQARGIEVVGPVAEAVAL